MTKVTVQNPQSHTFLSADTVIALLLFPPPLNISGRGEKSPLPLLLRSSRRPKSSIPTEGGGFPHKTPSPPNRAFSLLLSCARCLLRTLDRFLPPSGRPFLLLNSQDAGAGSTNEAAHRHVGIGGAALVAVEALAVGREAAHLPQQLQVLLLLLPLGARRHGLRRGRVGSRSPVRSRTKRKAAEARQAPSRSSGGGGGEGVGSTNRRARVAPTRTAQRENRRGEGERRSSRSGELEPGPGRLNDEPRRNLPDTSSRNEERSAADALT